MDRNADPGRLPNTDPVSVYPAGQRLYPVYPLHPLHLSSMSSLSSSAKIANKTEKEFNLRIGKHLGKHRETVFGKHGKHLTR